jgi:small subunit ribosomal protein S8
LGYAGFVSELWHCLANYLVFANPAGKEKTMGITDPISDMLTRIRNAHMALHKEVIIPASKMKKAILDIMVNEGYIEKYEEDGRELKVYLKYVKGRPAITDLKRISKPGRRIYVGVEEIPRVQNGLGICILSTSKGVLEGKEAKNKRVGGELLCQIW